MADAPAELHAQAEFLEVWQRWDCGCASVGLRARPGAPRLSNAAFRAVRCEAEAPGVGEVQLTLHVDRGELIELEIWTGEFGVAVVPSIETLRQTATDVSAV